MFMNYLAGSLVLIVGLLIGENIYRYDPNTHPVVIWSIGVITGIASTTCIAIGYISQ